MAMIELTTGDILRADAEALVNTVNCVGIMGRGVALQFKNDFPENFKAYKAACARDEVQPGKMFVFETGRLSNPKFIINFPTKRHWRGKSRMEDIDSGLEALVEEIRNRGIRSIAIPPLGSGLGGLDWSEVRPRIEAALGGIDDVDVIIFEPNGAPAGTKSREVPSMSPGRAALIVLIHRYLGGLMDPFVTLLEVHQLMYFMQEAGEPLRRCVSNIRRLSMALMPRTSGMCSTRSKGITFRVTQTEAIRRRSRSSSSPARSGMPKRS
jgi:O-acetyl-ADP-ribose deacetylase (regulator of RNase III)